MDHIWLYSSKIIVAAISQSWSQVWVQVIFKKLTSGQETWSPDSFQWGHNVATEEGLSKNTQKLKLTQPSSGNTVAG